MKNYKATNDPLGILQATRWVVESAKYVVINADKLEEVSIMVKKRLDQGLESAETSFGRTENLEEALQLIFIEDVVNFCFWSEPKNAWNVEWPKGNTVSGGWYALKSCFERARTDNKPILRADFLAELSIDEADMIFKGMGGVSIPLLQERVYNLREAGKVLGEKYAGSFIHVLEKAGYDAINLVELLVKDFPSFRDISILDNEPVPIFKRPQIVAAGCNSVLSKQLARSELLTCFADYRLPQVFRHVGFIHYSPSLAEKVDQQQLILHGSREEIEIRAATIQGVELIREFLKLEKATDVDYGVWLVSQELKKDMKPHHRTRTIYY